MFDYRNKIPFNQLKLVWFSFIYPKVIRTLYHFHFVGLFNDNEKWHLVNQINKSLQWRNNERDDVSNYRRLDCLLNHLLRPRSRKTSKLRVTGLCEGKPPVTGGFSSQRASNAEVFPFDDVIINTGSPESRLFVVITTDNRRLTELALCERKPPVIGGFSAKVSVMSKVFPRR